MFTGPKQRKNRGIAREKDEQKSPQLFEHKGTMPKRARPYVLRIVITVRSRIWAQIRLDCLYGNGESLSSILSGLSVKFSLSFPGKCDRPARLEHYLVVLAPYPETRSHAAKTAAPQAHDPGVMTRWPPTHGQ